MTLTLPEARRIALYHQGLLGIAPKKGEKAILGMIEQLGYVQIDTISVVARAHHHTLWSRQQDYRENHLHALLEKKKIFEYWSHAASYLPMCDYRFSLVRKQIYARGKTHWFGSLGQNLKLKKYVLDRIKAEGPLQSKDFEYVRTGTPGWYEWKPAKRALEQLFMEGKLMVAGRQGFQKRYDLCERVLPENTDITLPTEKEYGEHLILNALKASGIASIQEICYLRGYAKPVLLGQLKRLVKEGTVQEVQVEKNGTYYLIADTRISEPRDGEDPGVHLLGPFDNAVIQRKRLKNLFDFDFLIECYVPEAKRRYGYFCLPVLEGDRFVARLDPKADRASKTFHVRRFHPEKGWKPDEIFARLFAEKLMKYATFCSCNRIVCGKDMPSVIRKKLIKMVK
jgi:uncharacterized protein YcaQ